MKTKNFVERIIEDASCRPEKQRNGYSNADRFDDENGRELLLDDVTELLTEMHKILKTVQMKLGANS